MTNSVENFIAARKLQATLDSMQFPAASLLKLYSIANKKDVYCNHFAGFKLLTEWLAPIDTSAIALEDATTVDSLLINYEVTRIAAQLNVNANSLTRFIHRRIAC